MSITVLRLGHRPQRDKRLSTHLLLAARAFGAKKAFYSGSRDPKLEESINKVSQDWGGQFPLSYQKNWRKLIREWDGKIVHLTMYGLNIQNIIDEIRKDPSPKLVVVGGSKVPRDLYESATWNVSITTQPHSEVSALAVFLHEIFQGTELSKEYIGAKRKIIPNACGKEIVEFSKD
jgi:tRNA (cytidine56-2'-O)-methyltransferase